MMFYLEAKTAANMNWHRPFEGRYTRGMAEVDFDSYRRDFGGAARLRIVER